SLNILLVLTVQFAKNELGKIAMHIPNSHTFAHYGSWLPTVAGRLRWKTILAATTFLCCYYGCWNSALGEPAPIFLAQPGPFSLLIFPQCTLPQMVPNFLWEGQTPGPPGHEIQSHEEREFRYGLRGPSVAESFGLPLAERIQTILDNVRRINSLWA